MPEIKASLRYLKISPRKVRLITSLVKGLPLFDAETQLKHTPNRSAQPLLKLLLSAKANAVHNFQLDPAKLFIKNISVDCGPIMKRTMPRARGSADIVRHRISHVNLILGTKEDLKSFAKEDKSVIKTKEVKERNIKNKTNKTKRNLSHSSVKATKGQSKPIIQRKVIN